MHKKRNKPADLVITINNSTKLCDSRDRVIITYVQNEFKLCRIKN